MTIIEITNLLSNIAESVMFFMLFEAFLKRRENIYIKHLVFCAVGLTILLYICNHLFLFSLQNAVGIFIAALIATFLYRGKFIIRLIAVITGTLICGLTEMIILYSITFILNLSVTDVIYFPEYRILGIILSKMLGIAICNGIRIRTKMCKLNIKPIYWALFILLFSNGVLVVFLFFRMTYELKDIHFDNLVLLSSGGLFFSIFFALYLYEHMAEQNQIIREQEQFEQQMNSQLKHMDEIVLQQNELRRFKHDINNQIVALESYFESGDLEGGRRHMAALSQQFRATGATINTGNNALDAILSTKKSLAESKGIVFHTELRIQKSLPLDAKDLCVIFGNALDNAIEACNRLPENTEKRIDLLLMQDAHSLFCALTNTAPAKNDRIFTTSKADKTNHGFGLQNIRDALANYGAEPSIEQEGERFSLSFNIVLQ